jgi:hypothetical protein
MSHLIRDQFVHNIVCFFTTEPPTPQFTPKIELATLYTFDLQSIPFKYAVQNSIGTIFSSLIGQNERKVYTRQRSILILLSNFDI